MRTTRRTMLALTGAAAAMPAFAQGGAGGNETLPLWPGTPPGGPTAVPLVEKAVDQSHDPAHPDRFVTGIAQPRLIVYRPDRPNGAAMLLLPGGGYGFLSYDNEGVDEARWLNACGITAYILMYRLPGEGWANRADVPLQDAQRAMRLIRANAGRHGIDTRRVMVLGFSAGGHLAGSLATRHAQPVYAAVDQADSLSARPDLAGLIYPVVSLSAAFTHVGSRDALLGTGSTEARRRLYSVENHVDATTPPCFIVHAGDDGLVPPANSIALYTALHDRGRPVELHMFASGGHGFGVLLPVTNPASAWPRLLVAFASSQGLLPPSAT